MATAPRPKKKPSPAQPSGEPRELVILTGLSGAGKASALKAFEDLGFHCVDNLPLELLPDLTVLLPATTTKPCNATVSLLCSEFLLMAPWRTCVLLSYPQLTSTS